MNKAVFLDRDGVINEVSLDKELYYKLEDIRIIPGVIEAIKVLKNKGFLVICITNQPVIARGLASIEEIDNLNGSINKSIEGLIDQFYLCPHHPEVHQDVPEHARKYRIACTCRKPLIGMLELAKKNHNIDLEKSWFIGDTVTDILCGKNAGCKTIKVKSSHSHKLLKSSVKYDSSTKPDFEVQNLLEAAKIITKN